MLIFKHMCVASDSRTTVVAMLLLVENEYELCITVRSLGVSGVTRISDKGVATPCCTARVSVCVHCCTSNGLQSDSK